MKGENKMDIFIISLWIITLSWFIVSIIKDKRKQLILLKCPVD